MKLQTDDEQFITQTLPTLEGWLLDDSAYLTSALLRWQSSAGITGGIFEIGVFAGKYLALLYHLTAQTGGRVLGLDTFQWYPQEKVEENFKRIFVDPSRLVLMTADSTRVQPDEIIEKLGTKPRFISVDGAHTAAAVLNDLKLSERILAPGGVVAIDDVLNPRAIGVVEGAHRYFLNRNGEGLVPFAYCANKLYAAHRSDVERCHQAAWRFPRDNPGLNVALEFNNHLEKGPDWVQQDFFGFPVVIF